MRLLLIRSKTTDSAVFKTADSLHKQGFEVNLLVWDRQNNLNDKYPYTIHKFGLNAPYDTFTALLYLPLWWIYELMFLLKHDYDVVHSCDLDTLYPSIIAKLLKGNKLFYTIYDFYANNFPDMKPYFLSKLVRKIVSAVEKWGIGFTDTLFLTDENRYSEVKGAKVNNVVYIYNSPPDILENIERPSGDNLKIFYGGGILKQRGINYMVEAVEGLDNVKLLIGGSGPDAEDFKEYSSDEEGKIYYMGWLPTYEDILDRTIESDLLFRFLDPKIPRAKYDSPNKVFEAMMCGKPIIVNKEMGISRIIKKEECGETVPYADVDSLKKVLVRLRDDEEYRMRLGRNARRAYIEKYDWNIMEKRLKEAYSF
ncbi:glycosyltransferase family 4 protein [Methanobacterium alcaliphilum]|uniref:glycosyltransferase family 4 protein n=1 Tax=Methanobacterium alcaliphilum TaxID=392018 RepID=UPI00200B5ECA|nr:glycosyltransferase family 4 protein [Methanobacterium alcaliphilum]MCK9150786.1 glycosyltransferase family 4 protein [Methanobacterium alcaliphilum]